MTGAVSVAQLETAIKNGAEENSHLSSSSYGSTPSISDLVGSIYSFDVGTTNVPKDMVARIHQGEIITPKTYSDGIRNGDLIVGNVSSIESALDDISNSVNALVSISSSQLTQLKEIRDINNDSLVSLQNMEAII